MMQYDMILYIYRTESDVRFGVQIEGYVGQYVENTLRAIRTFMTKTYYVSKSKNLNFSSQFLASGNNQIQ